MNKGKRGQIPSHGWTEDRGLSGRKEGPKSKKWKEEVKKSSRAFVWRPPQVTLAEKDEIKLILMHFLWRVVKMDRNLQF